MRPALAMLLLLAACSGKGADCTSDDEGCGGGGGGEGGGEGGETGLDDTGTPTAACADVDNAEPLGDQTCVASAPCGWTGDQSDEYFAYTLDAGGDFDGDGVADVVFGSPGYDAVAASGKTAEDGGRATVLSGGSLATGPGDPVGMVVGEEDDDNVGHSVAFVGDFDGDGRADLVAGAFGWDAGGEDAGGALLVLGREAGESTWEPDASWAGEAEADRAGTMVAGAGDLDGDGLADVLIAGDQHRLTGDEEDPTESLDYGAAYVVFGASDGLATGGSLADAGAMLRGETSAYGAAGNALGSGDLDGDGTPDVVVGAPYAASAYGRVYAVPGGAVGGEASLSDAPTMLTGEAYGDAFGWALAVGDVTGDGVADLAVGAPLSDRAWDTAGAVTLYAGGPDFFGGSVEALASWDGTWDDQQLGSGLLLGPDIDGDGAGDLVVGAVDALEGLLTKAGKVWIVSDPASAAEDGPIADVATVTFHGGAVKDFLGRAAATADLDGDGGADLLLGSAWVNTDALDDPGAVYLFWSGAR